MFSFLVILFIIKFYAQMNTIKTEFYSRYTHSCVTSINSAASRSFQAYRFLKLVHGWLIPKSPYDGGRGSKDNEYQCIYRRIIVSLEKIVSKYLKAILFSFYVSHVYKKCSRNFFWESVNIKWYQNASRCGTDKPYNHTEGKIHL